MLRIKDNGYVRSQQSVISFDTGSSDSDPGKHRPKTFGYLGTQERDIW